MRKSLCLFVFLVVLIFFKTHSMLIFIVIIKDMYTRIDRSSKRPDTVVEIFFWVDKSETDRRLFKLSSRLMIINADCKH